MRLSPPRMLFMLVAFQSVLVVYFMQRANTECVARKPLPMESESRESFELRLQPGGLQAPPVLDARRNSNNKEKGSDRLVYVITPTYNRATQVADLTRLSHVLQLAGNVHWIVVEDALYTTFRVAEVLMLSGLSVTHMAGPTPKSHEGDKSMGRGVFPRRKALQWLRDNADPFGDSVFYFADDDNTYDVRLFGEMRATDKVSVFPVGLVLDYGISSPVVVDGRVVGFHDAYIVNRVFPIDMAGFCVSTSVLLAEPNATMPLQISTLEDEFLKMLNLKVEDLEPRANNCTQVLVWHTRTRPEFKIKPENMQHNTAGGVNISDTNLPNLYAALNWF